MTQAVEDAGGEGLRISFWNGHDLTTRRGFERLYQRSSQRNDQVTFGFHHPADHAVRFLTQHRNACLVL